MAATFGPVRLENFLDEALGLLGVPYLWGGKSDEGLDCSGLVTLSLFLAGGPDWRQTHNSQALLDELEPASELLPGDLVMYPRHVMLHLASGLVLGACDGDSKTTSLEIAARQGARVKTRRRFDYRRDVIGFRRIPFLVPRGDMSHGLIR